MPEFISTIEQLNKYLNDKGVLEIALRGKNQKFKQFQKVILQDLPQGQMQEQIKSAISTLNKNTQISQQTLQMVGNVAKLNQFNLILNAMNLCATCAGFTIICKRLDVVSEKINELLNTLKASNEIQINYEFKKIISEHANMLDSRKTQNYYSEEKMRELVDNEFNVLNMLISAFSKETTDERESLLFSIYSLAAMLAVSLKYFDEIYYYNHKETITNGDVWHMSHDKWMSIYDTLTSNDFILMIQDYGFFELNLNTSENDCYYKSLLKQITDAKQEVADNQRLIQAFDSDTDFRAGIEVTNCDIRETIFQAFNETDVSLEDEEIAKTLNVAFGKLAIAL